METEQHTIAIHHRHANEEGVVDSFTEQVEAGELEAGLKRANHLLANSHCRNWGCRIELDGQVIIYTLVRDNSPQPGPVRFCNLDAQALAKERNATLSFETAWKVNRDLQPLARPAARGRGRH
ncbi:MAG: hypothetical protein ACRD1C_13245 [Terriglobales bacterium]